ncbi:hypothetical protein [Bacillus velezensis]|nr:hypothetical protein [Bacillus velezensis]
MGGEMIGGLIEEMGIMGVLGREGEGGSVIKEGGEVKVKERKGMERVV